VMRLVENVPASVVLAMDEAYIEFLDEPVDLVPLIRSGKHPNLILMRTFSKIYGLAGLRLGYGIAHPELIQVLEKVRQPFNINALVQAGALAALNDSEHLTRTRANNLKGLAFFENAFKDLSLEYVPSAGNFILVKVGEGQRVCAEMQKMGVIVRPMAGYQLPEWIRISVGTPEENNRCLGTLKQVLKKS
jgi:histidinol-phosphate aminotransferase